MTCMKQEFCIHEKYCQRHIGQNFDSCILFSRNSKPMTNEEWIRNASTEELAEFLFGIACICSYCGDDSHSNKEKTQKCLFKAKYGCQRKDWEKWLKQPHREKE